MEWNFYCSYTIILASLNGLINDYPAAWAPWSPPGRTFLRAAAPKTYKLRHAATWLVFQQLIDSSGSRPLRARAQTVAISTRHDTSTTITSESSFR
eukprot:6546513-Pyramimonas_sp.AAC.1